MERDPKTRPAEDTSLLLLIDDLLLSGLLHFHLLFPLVLRQLGRAGCGRSAGVPAEAPQPMSAWPMARPTFASAVCPPRTLLQSRS
eukprot:3238194-Prymnesium_polylepis.1